MFREALESFLDRLENDHEIGYKEIYSIVERMASCVSSEDIIDEYGIAEEDLDRILSHYAYNEPDEIDSENCTDND